MIALGSTISTCTKRGLGSFRSVESLRNENVSSAYSEAWEGWPEMATSLGVVCPTPSVVCWWLSNSPSRSGEKIVWTVPPWTCLASPWWGSILDECGVMAPQASRQQPSLGAGCGDTTCDWETRSRSPSLLHTKTSPRYLTHQGTVCSREANRAGKRWESEIGP